MRASIPRPTYGARVRPSLVTITFKLKLKRMENGRHLADNIPAARRRMTSATLFAGPLRDVVSKRVPYS